MTASNRFTWVRGWVAIALALAAAVLVPNLLPAKAGHAGLVRPLTAGDWALAVLLLSAPLVASFIAWHRRLLSDQVCAVASMLLTLLVLYRLIDWMA